MKPAIHLDLTIVPPNEECLIHDQMALLWRRLHQTMSVAKIPFAVAFPKYYRTDAYDPDDRRRDHPTLGNILRVWVGPEHDKNQIEQLLREKLPPNTPMSNAASLSQPTTITHAFMMRRIASNVARSRRGESRWIDSQTERRQRQKTEQIGLPYIRMRSSKTTKPFRLVVDKQQTDEHQYGEPNGYGLSRATQIIAIPEI